MHRVAKFVVGALAKPSKPRGPLGRWGRERDKAQLDKKIDLANEDHCGPCGQYALRVAGLEKETQIAPEKRPTEEAGKTGLPKEHDRTSYIDGMVVIDDCQR